jgi:hypothetical protein
MRAWPYTPKVRRWPSLRWSRAAQSQTPPLHGTLTGLPMKRRSGSRVDPPRAAVSPPVTGGVEAGQSGSVVRGRTRGGAPPGGVRPASAVRRGRFGSRCCATKTFGPPGWGGIRVPRGSDRRSRAGARSGRSAKSRWRCRGMLGRTSVISSRVSMNLRAPVIVSGSSVNGHGLGGRSCGGGLLGGLIGDGRAAGSAGGSDDRSPAGDEDACVRIRRWTAPAPRPERSGCGGGEGGVRAGGGGGGDAGHPRHGAAADRGRRRRGRRSPRTAALWGRG